MANSYETRLKTRPDLKDEEWLGLIQDLPENVGIDVRAVYRRMIGWCRERNQNASRLRLLKWLDNERAVVPIDTSKEPDCPHCGNERRVVSNDFRVPCPKCRPDQNREFWKARGR